jgi:pimeloyl-ACP methyl ester carboxylesterase
VRQTRSPTRTSAACATRPAGRALRAAINYYRAVFRSPESQGSWPPWLRRFVHGDRPVKGVREGIEDWPKITAPTLLVWGENDVALGKELTLGTEALVAAPFEIKYIPLSGHWVQQEQPSVVNGYLLDFLGDLAPEHAPAAPAP